MTANRNSRRTRSWGILAALGLCALSLAGCSSFRQRTIDDRVAGDQLAVRGQNALRNGQQDQAIRLLQGAVDKKPGDLATRSQLVEALVDCGKIDDAIEQLHVAIDHDEPQLHLVERLADLYVEKGQLLHATRCVEHALQLDSQSAESWRIRGDIAFRQGNLSTALAHYQRSLNHEASSETVSLRIAEVYRRLDKPERAVATLENLIQRHPAGAAPVDYLLWQSELLVELDQRPRAVTVLTELSHREDAPPITFVLLSQTQQAGNQYTEALATLARGEARFPENAQLRAASQQLSSAAVDDHTGIASRVD